MNADAVDLSRKRFVVSILEIRQEIVFAEEFSGQYRKTVSLSDGSTRTVELTPVMRAGRLVIELNDTGHHINMGLLPVPANAQTTDNLMVQVFDIDGAEAAQAGGLNRLPEWPMPARDTSLISHPDFVPSGFTQGVEILNDRTTPMDFVVGVLRAHLGMSVEDSRDTMLAIHYRGGALIPTASLADAQRIAVEISAEALRSGHPLLCRATSIGA